VQDEPAEACEQERAGDSMKPADVKAITAPPPILESSDPYVKYWLGGFETMRSAIIKLLEMEEPALPNSTWSFTPTVARFAKQ